MQIKVAGTHQYSVAPERATLTLAVAVESGDRAAVTREASALARELDAALAALPEGTLESYSVGALTTRAWRPTDQRGKPGEPRYSATARVRAVFVDLAAIAGLVLEWGVRDGVRLDGVAWTLTDETRLGVESDALSLAVAAAKDRALVIARAAGFADVTPVRVSDPGLEAPSPRAFGGAPAMRAMAMGDEPAPVVPDDVRGAVTVLARFNAH